MSCVWHLTSWGFESGRVKVGTRRRWRTIGPVTVYFKPQADESERPNG